MKYNPYWFWSISRLSAANEEISASRLNSSVAFTEMYLCMKISRRMRFFDWLTISVPSLQTLLNAVPSSSDWQNSLSLRKRSAASSWDSSSRTTCGAEVGTGASVAAFGVSAVIFAGLVIFSASLQLTRTISINRKT